MIERTTVAADSADLAVLRDEARRRRVSLSTLLRQAVAREASELRASRRPRFGVANGGGAASTAAASPDEPYGAAGPGR